MMKTQSLFGLFPKWTTRVWWLSLLLVAVGAVTADAAPFASTSAVLPATTISLPSYPYFDHIIIIAMENQDYGTVLNTDASGALFLSSLLPYSSTIPKYHSYGSPGFFIGGCSAGCYVALTTGSDQGVFDGWCPPATSPCIDVENIASQLNAAGLNWAAFCEDGCGREADHFPWIGYYNTWNSCVVDFSTCAGSSSGFGYNGNPAGNLYNTVSNNPGAWDGISCVGDTSLIDYLNSNSPANFIWLTPADSHNMHNNTILSGDQYLQSLLIGTGTISNPSSCSILGSSLYKRGRTLVYIWWDEYDPSPNLEFGAKAKPNYISSSDTYDEFSSLRTLEYNYGLSYLLNAAIANTISDIFNPVP